MTGDGLRFAVRGGELAAAAALDALAHGWPGVHARLRRARAPRVRGEVALQSRAARARRVAALPSDAAALGARVAPGGAARRRSRAPGDCRLVRRPDALRSSLIVVFVPMLVEARRAARNERAQRARGGIEPAGDVYRVMRSPIPARLWRCSSKARARRAGAPARSRSAPAVFVAAQGAQVVGDRRARPCWTFRVIVVPGAPLVAAGRIVGCAIPTTSASSASWSARR